MVDAYSFKIVSNKISSAMTALLTTIEQMQDNTEDM